jgi:thiazole synthase
MLTLAGEDFNTRFILGTALYPSPEIMEASIKASGAELVTVSIRRQAPTENAGQEFWDIIKALGVKVLPNTAGCRSVKEAVTTAHMAREIFDTNWLKLEVIGDDYTLQPDPPELLEAARILIEDGFEIFPYTTDDLVIAERLVSLGCSIVMPWGSPIGSGQGLLNKYNLRTLRQRLPDIKLIIDAGIGKPSDAAMALEMGYDAVLLNSAVALAQDPVRMAEAFAGAVNSGRVAYESGIMESRDMASPSTPTIGTPFWHSQAAE